MRLLYALLLALTTTQAFAAGAPVRIDDGDTVTEKADVTVSGTATLVSASNSNRASLTCSVTDAVRWGSATVTTTSGVRIAANGAIAIRNTAAVYMIAEDVDSTVSCTEETYASTTGPVFSP